MRSQNILDLVVVVMIVAVIARIRMIPVARRQRMIIARMVAVADRRWRRIMIAVTLIAACQRNGTADKPQGKLSHLHE